MTEAINDRSAALPPPVRSNGRTALSVAAYALSTAFMFISPLVPFVPAALLNCAFRNGRRAAWVALFGAASILAAASRIAQNPQAAAAETSNILAFVLAVGAPTLLIFSMVREGRAFGKVLLTGVAASGIGLLVTEAVMRLTASYSPYEALVANFRENSRYWLAMYRSAHVPEDALQMMKRWSEVMAARFIPSLLLAPAALMFVLSLVMLSRLPAWRDFVASRSPLDFTRLASGPYLFRNLALPEWLLFAFVLGGISPLLSGAMQTIGGNVLAVVGFLYLLQGLAVFRSVLFTIGAGFVGVMIAYLTLAMLTLSGIGPLILGIAGLFDSFFDFRHFNRKDDSHESHID
jgi:hypothetical protein